MTDIDPNRSIFFSRQPVFSSEVARVKFSFDIETFIDSFKMFLVPLLFHRVLNIHCHGSNLEKNYSSLE
jgi:hypothetical protein